MKGLVVFTIITQCALAFPLGSDALWNGATGLALGQVGYSMGTNIGKTLRPPGPPPPPYVPEKTNDVDQNRIEERKAQKMMRSFLDEDQEKKPKPKRKPRKKTKSVHRIGLERHKKIEIEPEESSLSEITPAKTSVTDDGLSIPLDSIFDN